MVELGLLLGGLFRLAPEVLRFFGKKTDNSHELALLREQTKLEALRYDKQKEAAAVEGQFGVWEQQLSALREATAEQGRPSGIRWIDGWSKLMRPLLTTYWAIVLYSVVLGCKYYTITAGGVGSINAVLTLWGEPEMSLVNMMVSFWFVDRTLKHVKVN